MDSLRSCAIAAMVLSGVLLVATMVLMRNRRSGWVAIWGGSLIGAAILVVLVEVFARR